MFRLYHSNKLDVLKGILSHVLKSEPLTNPFETEKILVQSPGMAQWLKMELAQDIGICANIEFPLPASFIWQTFVDVLPQVPKRSAFNKDAMAWQIMTRLPDLLALEAFSELQAYLSDDEPLKLYQLAYKIADIYDQYLVYRPHWIKAWQAGSLEFSQQQPWQAILWQDLAQAIIDSGQSHYHRANLYEHLIDALKNKAQPSLHLPQRIFVFGVSALPPNYLEALHALADHCDVHFFLNNPCQVYWGDIVDAKWLMKLQGQQRQALDQVLTLDAPLVKQSTAPLLTEEIDELFNDQGSLTVGNPLLASMGKLGRDNQALMLELAAQEIEAFCPSEADAQGFTSLLGAISDDILFLRDPSFIGEKQDQLSQGHKRTAIKDDDNSIVIHRCHSAMREVEVLHDQILDMLANDRSLTPKDIVVMMPDVNAYSPYIQAVFSSAKHRIDFSISDRNVKQEKPLLLSFLMLLDLNSLRQTANELFNLLEVPAIMAQFELTPQALKRLKLWIDESGIRHGLGQNDAFDDVVDNSWQFGLNRMFKGYSQREQGVNGEQESLWQNIFAYEEPAGLVAQDLGQLALFVQLIGQYKTLLQGERTYSEWREIIDKLLQDFYQDSLDNEQELAVISQCLDELNEQLILASFDQVIASEVLFEHLRSNISSGQSSQRFLAGKLNFCTLMPMRSIPFKVVCVLGMNDGVYPRTIAPLGFDLMADDPQKGDRCRRDDDRYLFLEAMLSAQQIFYISYCGRHIKDNTIRCPSVLVNELTDYISQSYRLASDSDASLEQCSENLLKHLVTEHPLAPFNHQYYKPNEAGLFSYQEDWIRAATDEQIPQAFIDSPLTIETLKQVIELDQLKRFIKQPCQYFLNQRLGVYFGNNEHELDDSEPFMPDGLQSYLIKNNLLASHLKGNNLSQLNKLRAQGILPHGHFADLFLSEHQQAMDNLADNIRPYLAQQTQDLQVNLALTPPLDGLRGEQYQHVIEQMPLYLQGWLKQRISPNSLIRYKPGKANAKFFVDCYIDYLAFCATPQSTPPQDVVMFTQDGQWRFKPLPAEHAREHLSRLLGHFVVASAKPMPFFLQSAWNYVAVLFCPKTLVLLTDEKTLQKAKKALMDTMIGNDRVSGEADDLYNQRCYPNLLQTHYDEFMQYSTQLLLPILTQLEELSDDS